jgi:hypothetical protein
MMLTKLATINGMFLVAAMGGEGSSHNVTTAGDGELAARLVKNLDDADEAVRREAVQQLRLLARRVDRVGGKRIQRGGEFEPKVKGLVPALIRASGDRVETNRMVALYALADTLDPAAIAAIRDRLKDQAESVRFNAACLLTEFNDVSGLPELKKALVGLRKPGAQDPLSPYGIFGVERLLASFERATGKSFGEIPLSPALMSDSRAAEAATRRHQELLDTWDAWWEWVPSK